MSAFRMDISVSFHGRVWVHFSKKERPHHIPKENGKRTHCVEGDGGLGSERWRWLVVRVVVGGSAPGFATS